MNCSQNGNTCIFLYSCTASVDIVGDFGYKNIRQNPPHLSTMCPMGGRFMSKDVKEPITYSQQIAKLQQRDIIIHDLADCEVFLSQVNYYRLSGYILPFIDPAADKCCQPIEFDTIKSIYHFDAELRNLISLSVERIEIYIRTQLAYFHAHHYGALGYIDPANYNSLHDHITFLGRIQSCIKDNSKSPVVIHHQTNYGGKFPIWVIIDYFTLGMLSHFYTDMPNQDKAFLAKTLYAANFKKLSSWLRCLTDLRNRCAHYSRLYYWAFSAIPNTGNPALASDRTLYPQIHMLRIMYPDKAEWATCFYNPLVKLVDKYKDQIQLDHIGFPANWKDELK